MLEDSIRTVQDVEARMEAEKASCRTEAQRIVAAAEKAAMSSAEAAEETLRQERAARLLDAEAQAAEERKTILAKAAEDCAALRAEAQRNMDAAVRQILAKGV